MKRKKSQNKYPDDHGKNESFTKKLYCGKCGSLVGYSRMINRQKTNYEARWWRCYQSIKGNCDSMYTKQEYIEENFSQLLSDIKFNAAFSEYLNAFIEDLRIKPEEENRRVLLENEKEELNQKLYEAVEDELGRKGKDAKMVDYLTDEIMKIRAELLNYTEREEQLEAIDLEIINLGKTLEDLKSKRKDDFGYYQDSPRFQAELFEQFIEKGTIFENGEIVYQFYSGFEWKSPINYKAFQEQLRMKKAMKRAAEKEAFLKGPEVRDLLKFCREPKKMTEMREYLPRYLTNVNFKKFIIIPLMDKGLIKQTIPDKPQSRLQKYYSLENDNETK